MKLHGIRQCFGDRVALDIPEFEFERGRIYAIVGSNGCGKTTLARVVCGLIEPTVGTREPAPGEECGYMPQISYAFYGTVRHNVQLGLPSGARDRVDVDAVMASLGLGALSGAKAKSLSGGETARLALARTLVGDHTVLVLDEPTAAFDVNATLVAEHLIRTYQGNHDACVLLITHSIAQARRVSDRIVFMDGGCIVEEGPTSQTLRAPKTGEFQHFLEIVGA